MKKYVRKEVVYNREKLFDEVWEEPIVAVAKKYGVSDVMIHKYCKNMSIPTPPRGYWNKKESGLPVEKKPKLPKYSGIATIRAYGNFAEDVPQEEEEKEKKYELTEEERQMNRVAKENVQVVDRHKFHPVIQKHREVFSDYLSNYRAFDEKAKYGEKPWDWRPYKAPLFWQQIMPKTISKFHKLANALILAIESAGGTVTEDFKVVIGKDMVQFGAYETRERIIHEPDEDEKIRIKEYEEGVSYWRPSIRKYDYIRNGELNFYIFSSSFHYYDKPYIVYEKDYSDLKDFVSAVIDAIFSVLPESRKERVEREEQLRLEREAAERKARIEKAIRDEKEKVIELQENASNYIMACNIRAYVKAVESKENLTEEEKEWITWAKEKAEWIDPTIKKEDSILGHYNKDSLVIKETHYRW